MNIGERIKGLRRLRKLTLADISQSTGIPSSSLSRMENTTLSLNYDKLLKIAEALGVDIVDIVSADSPKKPNQELQSNPLARCSTAYKKDEFYLDEGGGKTRYLFTDLKKKNMEVALMEVKPLPVEETEFLKHPGEKYAYVLSGRIEIHFEYYSHKILEQGDAIYFDSDMWHSATALDGKPAQLLVSFSVDPNAESEPEIMMGDMFMAKSKPI